MWARRRHCNVVVGLCLGALMLFLGLIPAIVQAQPSQPLKAGDNVVLLMHFEGDLSDSSKAKNVTRNHGAVFVDDGKFGKAVLFDGKTFAQVMQSKALNWGTSSFTVEYWFKMVPKEDGINNFPYVGSGYHGFRAGQRTSIYDAQLKDHAFCDVKNPFTDGQWHHYAAVFDRGNRLTVYIDGKTVAGTDKISIIKAPLSAATDIMIGTWYGAKPEDTYKGLMDELRITQRASTLSELGYK